MFWFLKITIQGLWATNCPLHTMRWLRKWRSISRFCIFFVSCFTWRKKKNTHTHIKFNCQSTSTLHKVINRLRYRWDNQELRFNSQQQYEILLQHKVPKINPAFYSVGIEGFHSKHKAMWAWNWLLSSTQCQGIWHSEDPALWYILIIKANEMHYFSTLFR